MHDVVSLDELLSELAEVRGLDFRGYKPSTVERRICKRMSEIHIGDFATYLQYFREHPGEIDEILKNVLINVTEFFRDPPAWDIIQHQVLPMLLKRLPVGGSFRAWSAGCASGEEPFSLAILIAEYFGSKIKEYDIEIYATDKDEDALNVARRAIYPVEALRRLPLEWQTRYFNGDEERCLIRDVRRMVIFGRSDLAADAPISHVQLLICRNVLIYFGVPMQRQIMKRFQYALDPGGVLFLGKAETQLKSSAELFRPLNSRWRIFERVGSEADREKTDRFQVVKNGEQLVAKTEQELQLLQLIHSSVLDTVEPGIIILDAKQTVITENESVGRMWKLGVRSTGQQLADTELSKACAPLAKHVRVSIEQDAPSLSFKYQPNPDSTIQVTVRPIRSDSGAGRVGTLIYMEDVTPREALQTSIHALQTTTEELQASNEELETTNEELQSTNEELETTNEELQSSNEELETTNEELQSLNEELETTNEELAVRTREVEEMNVRYREMLQGMPWPVLLVNGDQKIYTWSTAAQRFFGFATPSDKGMRITELPMPQELRNLLVKRHREVLQSNKPAVIRNRVLGEGRGAAHYDIHITPLSTDGMEHGVLLIFHRVPEEPQLTGEAANGKQKRSSKKIAKTSRPARESSRTPKSGSSRNGKKK